MSNVIQFLEALGRAPAMPWSGVDYAAAVAALEADPAQRDALLDRDAATLNRLLGGRAVMYCSQYPAREDQPAEEESDTPAEEQPDEDGQQDKSALLPRRS